MIEMIDNITTFIFKILTLSLLNNLVNNIIHLFFSTGTVEEANINRSPTSYEANPEDEKAK